MQHDISETIILQGGEQGWLLEHKHRHHLGRYVPKRQRQEQGGKNKSQSDTQTCQHNINKAADSEM